MSDPFISEIKPLSTDTTPTIDNFQVSLAFGDTYDWSLSWSSGESPWDYTVTDGNGVTVEASQTSNTSVSGQHVYTGSSFSTWNATVTDADGDSDTASTLPSG